MSGTTPERTGYATRTLPNIVAVARREVFYRIRTRAYRFTTLLLVVAGVALASAPAIITKLTSGGSGDRVEVIVGDSNPSIDVVKAFNSILNASAASGGVPTNLTADAPPAYDVVAGTDVESARADVVAKTAIAAIVLSRDAAGDLTYQLYSDAGILSRSTQFIQQAAISITIQDRLTRAGIPPLDQARLFAPPTFTVTQADPNALDKPGSSVDAASTFVVTFGLSIAIFMAIILYGQWIAYSVIEEKSSRVMEVVLAAATPFQLLTGKVLGVGALALLQYVIVTVPAIVAVIFQGQIAALILGGSAADVSIPTGLTLGLLAAFGVLFVLGFALYATLYAGAASLISRTEDFNQIAAPLTLISVAGYLVATYSASGLIDINSRLVVILSYIPFFSPYLMLIRLGVGAATPFEAMVAILILAAFVPIALWFAARVYRSGVLLYGQRPSPRTFIRALRAR
jgi:ABC-2 type transport system permease protein